MSLFHTFVHFDDFYNLTANFKVVEPSLWSGSLGKHTCVLYYMDIDPANTNQQMI